MEDLFVIAIAVTLTAGAWTLLPFWVAVIATIIIWSR